jgi:glycyl-tRNA synthetase alpha subunit
MNPASAKQPLAIQELLIILQRFWAEHRCVLQ